MKHPITPTRKIIVNRIYAFTFLATNKKRAVKRGRMSKVNIILTENSLGKGLTGKVYNPFPTKSKSKYVPTKDAKRMAAI